MDAPLMASFEHLLIGRQVADRYTIESLVGRGGMGAVFRAADARLERPVALKVLSLPPLPPQETSRMRARFQREARAAAAIVHPNVVTIYDYGTDPRFDLDYLCMELLEGTDLSGVMEAEGPLAPERVVPLLRQAAEGLAAGHARGIVHRDVKPGNLFLSRPGATESVRVLDFGIAQLSAAPETLTRLTQFGAAPQSPAYASPEQERGDGVLTPATDVYSLGLTALALLTGVPQRIAPDATQALDFGPLGERVRRMGLESVIRQCLRLNPAERYGDAAAVSEALRSIEVGPGRFAAEDMRVVDERTLHHHRRASGNPHEVPTSGGEKKKLRFEAIAVAVAALLLAAAVFQAGLRGYSARGAESAAGFTADLSRTADDAIQEIRSVVRDVDGRKGEMPVRRNSAVGVLPSGGGFGVTSAAYLDGGEVRKLVDHLYRDGYEATVVETYFRAGDVVFRYEHAPNPAEVTDGRRYYYDAGRPVRVRQDARLVVPGTSEYEAMNPDSVRSAALAEMRESESWPRDR
jgi:Protein kinase domain